jgi:hypothetical protein
MEVHFCMHGAFVCIVFAAQNGTLSQHFAVVQRLLHNADDVRKHAGVNIPFTAWTRGQTMRVQHTHM